MRHAPLLCAFALAGCDVGPQVQLQSTLPGPPDQQMTVIPPEPPRRGNHAPTASLQVKGWNGNDFETRTNITFDASETRDLDGDPLTFQWSIDVGELTVTGTKGVLVVDNPGRATVTVRVTDPYGGNDQATLSVAVVQRGVSGAGGGGGTAGSTGGAGGSTGMTGGGAGGSSGSSVVCPLPMANWHYDAAYDVTLANADIVATAAAISNGQVDFRVQFCDTPFPTTATHGVTWCLKTDLPGPTDACGSGSGSNFAFDIFSIPGLPPVLGVGAPGIDTCQAVTWDAASRILRVVLPVSALKGASTFQYKVGSVFGGSFGNNDWTPLAQIGGAMWALSPAPLPTFSGVSICSVRP